MSLWILKKKGVILPSTETEEGLSAKDFMDKMRNFYAKLAKAHGDITDGAEIYFLELLFNYPKSMVNRHMTETLKLLVALMYFESKPEPEDKDAWQGFSYEELGLLFDRSKATIHEVIKQKETEAKQLLADVQLREQAKEIALKQMVEEEKQKLKKRNKSE